MGRAEALGMLNLSAFKFVAGLFYIFPTKEPCKSSNQTSCTTVGWTKQDSGSENFFCEFLGVNIPQDSFNSCITETVNLKIFLCISTLARLCIEQLVFSMILWPKFWKLMLMKFYCKMMPKRHSGARWNKLNKGQVETSHYLYHYI